jgi:exodeoxyribonuclease VII small subunit
MKQSVEISFEKAMERLEEIVQALDRGDQPLEESLALYEEGVKLSGLCAKQLTEAQGKLEKLSKGIGGCVEVEALEL